MAIDLYTFLVKLKTRMVIEEYIDVIFMINMQKSKQCGHV